MKPKPLKHKDLWFCEACGNGITCKEEVLSALALAKKKIFDLYATPSEDFISFHEITEILDECFQIGDKE